MKKNIIFRILILLIMASAITSCTKDMPKSLLEILKRNKVEGYGNGGGGNIQAGGGGPSMFKGPNADYVHLLLSKVPGWKTSSCANCNDGVLPDVKINSNCQRDLYVAAAVSYAWAAESYYRMGDAAQASSMAAKMMENLQYAKNLCSSDPIIIAGLCFTLNIFPC